MRTKKITGIILAAGLALVSLTSCQDRLIRFTRGEVVKFTAGSAGNRTKAEYGTLNDPSAVDVVPIYWEENDLVRIFCEECGSPEIGDPNSRYADYCVCDLEEDKSRGRLAQYTETILRWGGEKTHHFYAIYPAPDPSNGIISFPKMTTEKAELKAKVPTIIKAAPVEDGVIKPEFKYQYLLAKESITGGTGDVSMKFIPLCTAIQFTIENGTESEMKIDGIALESLSHNLTGTFTADLAAWTPATQACPVCVTESGNKSALIGFTTSYTGGCLTLAAGATLTFTMFLMPCYESGASVDVNDLTFKVYKNGGSFVSTKLAYNDALKTGVPFPNHKMTYVTGLIVPGGAQWTVKYAPGLTDWTNSGVEAAPMPEYSNKPFVTTWTTGSSDNLVFSAE